MSSDEVEIITQRLRDELSRLNLSLAAASRAAGEAGPQRLKDVMAGKQKCPIDLVARLAHTGVDILYVMTGTRTPRPVEGLSVAEEKVLDNYRSLPEEDQASVRRLTNALAESVAHYSVKNKTGSN